MKSNIGIEIVSLRGAGQRYNSVHIELRILTVLPDPKEKITFRFEERAVRTEQKFGLRPKLAQSRRESSCGVNADFALTMYQVSI